MPALLIERAFVYSRIYMDIGDAIVRGVCKVVGVSIGEENSNDKVYYTVQK